MKKTDAALLPGLFEALDWKPNTPQLENAMTYAWESALKCRIRSIESNVAGAAPDLVDAYRAWHAARDNNDLELAARLWQEYLTGVAREMEERSKAA